MEEMKSEIPSAYLCPILGKVMAEPVAIVCGHIFEKIAIQQAIKKKGQCPVCLCELVSLDIGPKPMVKTQIEKYMKSNPHLAAFQVGYVCRDTTENTSTKDFIETVLGLSNEISTLMMNEGFEKVSDLKELTDSDLKDLDGGQNVIKMVHRKKILKALTDLQPSAAAAPPAANSTSMPSTSSTGATGFAQAKIRGLKENAELNGKTGVLEDYNMVSERFVIRMETQTITVLSTNFEIVHPIKMAFTGYSTEMSNMLQEQTCVSFAPRMFGLGDQPRCRDTQVILCVGPTGAGKSRLINYLLGKDLLRSENSLNSVTRKIEATSVLVHLRANSISEIKECFLVDSVGLMDTTLTNEQVLGLAKRGVEMGFHKLNRFVFVIREGRIDSGQFAAIEQASKWFSLNSFDRNWQCVVAITHCDAFKADTNQAIINKYREHPIVGKLYHESDVEWKGKKFRQGNFFCFGLPDLNSLDAELFPIYQKRLLEQKAAFLGLFFGVNYPPIDVVPASTWNRCTLL